MINQQKIFIKIIFIYLSFINKIQSINFCSSAEWSNQGITVAGSSSGISGIQLTRLLGPTDIFIDNPSSIYVLDNGNYRLMKYFRNSTIGIQIIRTVSGNQLNQFFSMNELTIDNDGNFYVLDGGLSRITKWNPQLGTTTLFVDGKSFINSNTNITDSLNNPMGMYMKIDTMIIWIADTNNHRIVKWMNSTIMKIIFGSYGSLSYQLNFPQDLYVINNTLYIADTINHRIQMYKINETNATTIAGITNYYGTQLNQLWNPTSIIVDQNQFMFIVNYGNSRIIQWKIGEMFGKILIGNSQYTGTGSDQLYQPLRITFDSIGNLYVVDTHNNRIQMFNITCLTTNNSIITTTLSSLTTTTLSSLTITKIDSSSQCDISIWSSDGVTVAGSTFGYSNSDSYSLYYPTDIWISSNDTFYVIDKGNYRVQLFNLNQNSGITIVQGSPGYGLNEFYFMDELAVDSNGNIYIIDGINSRITKYSPGILDGTIVAGGNSQGSTLNQMYYPLGFFLEPQTLYLWIADTYNCRIVKWMSLTNIILIAGSICGSDADQFLYPNDLYVDINYSYTLYVVDTANHRIQRWFQGATNGTTIAGQSTIEGNNLNQLSYPNSIIVDKNQIMFIVDTGNNRILQWIIGSDSGTIIAGTTTYGDLPYQLHQPKHIRFDSKGNLYAADTYNHRIQKFNLICSPTTTTITTSMSNETTTTSKQMITNISILTSTKISISAVNQTLSATSTTTQTSSSSISTSRVLTSTNSSSSSSSSLFNYFNMKVFLIFIILIFLFNN